MTDRQAMPPPGQGYIFLRPDGSFVPLGWNLHAGGIHEALASFRAHGETGWLTGYAVSPSDAGDLLRVDVQPILGPIGAAADYGAAHLLMLHRCRA